MMHLNRAGADAYTETLFGLFKDKLTAASATP
jgi:hypothetical protein